MTADATPISLVTGGAGFVGRHVVHALLQLGHDVFIVDDLSSGTQPKTWLGARARAHAPSDAQSAAHTSRYSVATAKGQTRQVHFVHQDLMTALLAQLGQLGEAAAPATVWPKFHYAFHLASIVGGRKVIDGDPLHVGVDLAIDALFFRWLTVGESKAERVLYASSSAAYPIDQQSADGAVALREDMLDVAKGHLGQPDMSYGWSKMTGEYLAHLAATHYGCKVACVRPFSGYGESQQNVYPIPAIAERVARGDDAIVVWGSGQQARDFIHIEDCVRGMLLAIERIEDGSAVNLGSGALTNFIEVAQLMLRLDGREAPVVPQHGQPVGVQKRYCDPSYMRRTLDFVPHISLQEGFARVLRAAHQRLGDNDTSVVHAQHGAQASSAQAHGAP